jgi:4-diphosphocytidyl-2-C-methyl-D-erythritol kinase
VTTWSEPAPAKVNLALHVLGRRADGYHLLDMLVAFPPVGDTLVAERARDLSLRVEGPMAGSLGTTALDDNLVLRAARGLSALAPGRHTGARLRLIKRLPVAGGVGGGSADAAAAIRLLCRIWDIPRDDPRVAELAVSLGADVPMCLVSRPLRASGVGESVDLLGDLPAFGILLVNPGAAVPTPEVFRRLQRRENPPLPAFAPSDREAFLALLTACRNDLEAPAVAIAPVIGDVLAALAGLPGCRLARMSGSGATCFGLFARPEGAEAAAASLASRHTGWWIAAAPLSGGLSSPG